MGFISPYTEHVALWSSAFTVGPFIVPSLGRQRLYVLSPPLHMVVKAEAQGPQGLGEILRVTGVKQHRLSLKVLALHLEGALCIL